MIKENVTIVTCDRCGKIYTNEGNSIDARKVWNSEVTKQADLCLRCASAFDALVIGFLKEQPPLEP